MKTAQEIIIKPIITERSAEESTYGRYTFEVQRGATKPEIKQVVEQLFEVKVLAVNTQNRSGKQRRVGASVGKTAASKKAVVTIDVDPQNERYMAKGGKEETVARKYKTSIEEFGFGQ